MDSTRKTAGKAGGDPTEVPWLRVIVVIVRCATLLAFTAVLCWRIAIADFTWIGGIPFDFTQLLNLLLAFFSIGLSAMFYFKATETSNAFYDRTYQFTKDFVEKLARIEERFGELLKGIHEDTSKTRDYMQSANQTKVSVTTDAPAVPPESVKTAEPTSSETSSTE